MALYSSHYSVLGAQTIYAAVDIGAPAALIPLKNYRIRALVRIWPYCFTYAAFMASTTSYGIYILH